MTPQKRNRRRLQWPRVWSSARRHRLRQILRAAPLQVRIIGGVVAVLALWFLVNGVYQVARKPAELFFPVSGVLTKTPYETWGQYEPIFQRHSTAVITPEFLAALAQVEAAGNPVATTYWRWHATWNLFELYRPASSAVGMYQITDSAYIDAKRYCIRDHAVVEEGQWHEWRSCWFNGFYARVIPTHAVEMTAARLDRHVATILVRWRIPRATLQQKQELAAVLHLCGNAVGEGFVKRGFRLTANQRCGDHDVRRYLSQVNAMKSIFLRWPVPTNIAARFPHYLGLSGISLANFLDYTASKKVRDPTGHDRSSV